MQQGKNSCREAAKKGAKDAAFPRKNKLIFGARWDAIALLGGCRLANCLSVLIFIFSLLQQYFFHCKKKQKGVAVHRRLCASGGKTCATMPSAVQPPPAQSRSRPSSFFYLLFPLRQFYRQLKNPDDPNDYRDLLLNLFTVYQFLSEYSYRLLLFFGGICRAKSYCIISLSSI